MRTPPNQNVQPTTHSSVKRDHGAAKFSGQADAASARATAGIFGQTLTYHQPTSIPPAPLPFIRATLT